MKRFGNKTEARHHNPIPLKNKLNPPIKGKEVIQKMLNAIREAVDKLINENAPPSSRNFVPLSIGFSFDLNFFVSA